MPNRTIYITALNNLQLNTEENVSGLINTLLDEHYKKQTAAQFKAEGQGKQ